MGARNIKWPEERIARFMVLFNQGLTYGAIAKALDITKNSVIGYATRNKLPYRYKKKPAKKDSVKPLRQTLPLFLRPSISIARTGFQNKVYPDAPKSLEISHNDLDAHHCRFIAGDPRDPKVTFCGHRIVLGAYCEYHANLCYRAAPKKEEKQHHGVAPTIAVR